MKKEDKSRQLLEDAFIELLKTCPMDRITVKMLCEKAQVSRNAFYSNYKDMDDVLKNRYRKEHYRIFKDKYKDPGYPYRQEHFLDFLDFFDQCSDMILCLKKWDLLSYIARYNTELVLSCLQEYEDEEIRDHAMYYLVHCTASYFYTCLYWIIGKKKESRQEIIDMVQSFQKKEAMYRKGERMTNT